MIILGIGQYYKMDREEMAGDKGERSEKRR